MDILANFLGHDIRTHREYYRLPEESIQVAKMSKLLFALERGEMGLQKGLTLEEVSVGPDEGQFIKLSILECNYLAIEKFNFLYTFTCIW